MFCCCDAGDPSAKTVLVAAANALPEKSAPPEKAVDIGPPQSVDGELANKIVVTVDVSAGTKVGLNVSGAGLNLKVKDIVAGGAIDTWNHEHPDSQVQVGDNISEVNGVRGDPAEAKPYTALVTALKGSQTLELVFVRTT
mmetsp:Transcript_25657/g.51396  ORF Transcript_25657/g.51396 Transcript_25657/m.51396 type:complete len:140 (+) Transcript_25657:71-490(+)